ncbi:ABC transporter permease subunit [Halocatena pleomorpha]|uniref:ABC transporter permease n=1 Tax=Halocatena pleomorpha TaxID=1785090 RepID=A0A3P3RER1_9EURY|nr:ABC transporter permease subunit [Halocatena pleomorpha]RRJ31458.1 ABC transporter permease [Halocatena pleomorpha]
MSIQLVAKKEFQDAIRSRLLLLVASLFTAFLAFYTYYKFAMVTPAEPAVVADLYRAVASVVAVVGTLLGYNAIVGERESGSLKFLLAQPHTRRDVVIGKFLGRAAAVTVTVGIAFAVLSVHYAVLVEASPSVIAYARFGGKILVLGVVFVAIAVAFSAAVRSTTVATWGAVWLAFLFAFVWDSVLAVIKTFLFTSQTLPPWYYLVARFNPKFTLVHIDATALDTTPFYLEAWFGGVILAGWLLVPLGVAYLRFQRGDLV